MTEGGVTVRRSPRSSEFGSGRGSPKVIGDGCTDANRKVLFEGVGQNPLPTANRGGFGGRAFR